MARNRLKLFGICGIFYTRLPRPETNSCNPLLKAQEGPACQVRSIARKHADSALKSSALLAV
jgi:hypothetical protein